VIRLTESDLVRIVKRVISEGTNNEVLLGKYTLKQPQVLSKNGKTFNLEPGTIFNQVGTSAEEYDFVVNKKNNLVFFCNPRTNSDFGFKPEQKY
jgi:hypothetical protein